MANSKSIADREMASAARAIALGYVVSRLLGPDNLPYVLQTESGLTLDQLEELLDVLEGSDVGVGSKKAADLQDVLNELYGIEALAQVLTLDPAHQFDRTAIAVLIECEARRASALVATLSRPNDIPDNNH